MGFSTTDVAYLTGMFVLGPLMGLAIVRGLVAAAGSRLSKGRQVAVAYCVYAVSGIFVSACGSANGGPPNFKDALGIAIGAALAGVLDLLIIRRRVTPPFGGPIAPPSLVQQQNDPFRRGMLRVVKLVSAPTLIAGIVFALMALSTSSQPVTIWVGGSHLSVPADTSVQDASGLLVSQLGTPPKSYSQELLQPSSVAYENEILSAFSVHSQAIDKQTQIATVLLGIGALWAGFWLSILYVAQGFRGENKT